MFNVLYCLNNTIDSIAKLRSKIREVMVVVYKRGEGGYLRMNSSLQNLQNLQMYYIKVPPKQLSCELQSNYPLSIHLID